MTDKQKTPAAGSAPNPNLIAIADAIMRVAQGNERAPGGLEGLTMVIGGEPKAGAPNLVGGLMAIAQAIDNLAAAVRERIQK